MYRLSFYELIRDIAADPNYSDEFVQEALKKREKNRFKEDGFYADMKKSKLHTATPYIAMHGLSVRSRALGGLKVPVGWNNGSLTGVSHRRPGDQTSVGIPASQALSL